MTSVYIPVAVPYIPPAIPVRRHTSETQQVQVQPEPCHYKDNGTPLPWWVYVLLLILAGVIAYVGRFR